MADGAGITFDAGRFIAFTRNFSQHTDQEQESVLLRVSMEALNRITKRTAVDTGRAISGWQMSAKGLGMPLSVSGPNVKGDAIAKGRSEGRFRKNIQGPVKVISMSNGVPHIIFLEFGPTSPKHPAGMVRVTLNELHAAKLLSGSVIESINKAARKAGAR